MLKIQRFILLLVVLLGSFHASAAVDNIRFENIDIEEGLSQQTVNTIFQDSKGFMWFGTQEGLNRYDGISFTTYKPELNNPDSISNPWVKSITEDQNGNLWIATSNGANKLNRENDKFTRYLADHEHTDLNDKEANVVLTDRYNNVWVGTRKGLNKYIPSEDRFIPYTFMTAEGSSVNVLSMVEDIAGILWIGTEKYGLLRFNSASEKLTFVDSHISDDRGNRRASIKSLYIDEEQVLWMGTQGFGLYTLDIKQPHTRGESPVLEQQVLLQQLNIYAIEKDQQGTLWLGTSEGLYYKTQDNNQYIKLQPGNENLKLENTQVWSLYSDRGGVFWVGSFVGLSKWNTRTTQFDHYFSGSRHGGNLSGNNITAIGALSKDLVYVSNYKRVDVISPQTSNVVQMPLKTPGKQHFDGLQPSTVMSIMTVSDSEVWFGHRGDGATKFNPKTNEYKYYRYDPKDPNTIGQSGITSMIKAQDGTLWFATYDGGLSKYLPETDSFYSYQHDPSDVSTLSDNKIMVLHEDTAGNIWVGTWSGLNLFVPATGTVFRMKRDADNHTSLASNAILSIYQDSDENIWVGTQGGGLNLLTQVNIQNGRIEFEKLHSGNTMPSDVVYGILEDQSGYLWVSTNRGLVKINRNSKETSVYTKAQGIQGNEFNSGSSFKDDAGYLYFGGTNGVSRFKPEHIQPNPIIPNVEFTNFQRLNKFETVASQLNKKGQLEVEYTDYLIGIEFAALDFASPRNNRYKYKLEGFDQDWIEVRDVKRASYTNLPSGQYTFRVIGSNSDGVWNETGSQIALIVHPAPWYSWWAYLVYAMLIILVIRYIYIYFERKSLAQAQYQEQLEHEVNQRTLELSEANQQLFEASITDQLTGLHNRRYLSEHIEQRLEDILHEFSECILSDSVSCTSGPRLMALMFDLDGFKPINDNYGHEAGDKVIKQVADILTQQCSNQDIVIRWGGDEYLIVARVDDLAHAQQLTEQIRLSIANHAFDIGLSGRFHLSSSLGFALYPFSHHAPHSISWDQVHLLADHALYKSKDAGRNTWTGIVETSIELPFSKLNALVPNLDKAIEEGDIEIVSRN